MKATKTVLAVALVIAGIASLGCGIRAKVLLKIVKLTCGWPLLNSTGTRMFPRKR